MTGISMELFVIFLLEILIVKSRSSRCYFWNILQWYLYYWKYLLSTDTAIHPLTKEGHSKKNLIEVEDSIWTWSNLGNAVVSCSCRVEKARQSLKTSFICILAHWRLHLDAWNWIVIQSNNTTILRLKILCIWADRRESRFLSNSCRIVSACFWTFVHLPM